MACRTGLSSRTTGMTKEQLLAAVPDYVDRCWPKSDTAAQGGPATPGRGEAVVAITRFILDVVPEDAVPTRAEKIRQMSLSRWPWYLCWMPCSWREDAMVRAWDKKHPEDA